MQPTSKPPAVPTASLVTQVHERREQLERGLSADSISPATRADIDAALAALVPMLTGDLDNVPDAVRRDMSRWLDASKYIGVHAVAPIDPASETVAASEAPASDAPAPATEDGALATGRGSADQEPGQKD